MAQMQFDAAVGGRESHAGRLQFAQVEDGVL